MQTDMIKPSASAIDGTYFLGTLRKILIICVTIKIIGTAVTASQKFV
ncbi:hypothetical protein B4092_2366 [Bacillus licheniformis]|nr:hypothetical protein B4092_2366 [Bacillus licheniformis]TWN16509.1 hypothetical protein CHCC14564_1074 [Bacillus licheniformis LMG 17339]KYC75707.1 hypothetical protein B4090_2393 [Bacillus licheniformis]KYC83880.1 hypothetical protein B4091_2459 [Bacillus licheniformis]TWJ41107.1 hypothetical protein CHCC5025_2061 [Bacillus licheniformis]